MGACPSCGAESVAGQAFCGSCGGSPYHLAQALLDLAESCQALDDDAADPVAEALAIGQALRSPLVIRRAVGG